MHCPDKKLRLLTNIKKYNCFPVISLPHKRKSVNNLPRNVQIKSVVAILNIKLKNCFGISQYLWFFICIIQAIYFFRFKTFSHINSSGFLGYILAFSHRNLQLMVRQFHQITIFSTRLLLPGNVIVEASPPACFGTLWSLRLSRTPNKLHQETHWSFGVSEYLLLIL